MKNSAASLKLNRIENENSQSSLIEANMRKLLQAVLPVICLAALSAQAETAAQNSKPAQSFHDCKNCPEMVVIPAGVLLSGFEDKGLMGLDGRYSRRASISRPFALGKTEVTQGQWRLIMGDNPSSNAHGGDNCPVENVSWWDVQEFIKKLNAMTGKQYRLPSEAEWEYACHAGGQEEYCGSNDVNSVAWYSRTSSGTTKPAMTKQSNAWGLFDMSGNLYEWVEDGWHRNFRGAPPDESAWKGDEAYHVVRGGAFDDASRHVASSYRSYYESNYRGANIGFRLAKSDVTTISSEKTLAVVIPKEKPLAAIPHEAVVEATPAVSTQAVGPLTQKLRDLQSLKAEGVITEEEYQNKRKELLEKF